MSRYTGNIITKSPATPTGPLTTGRAPGMWTLSEAAYWTKQGLWPNANLVPDQYFPYVSLLLSTTSLGNANNNLFVDSSGAFNPVSRNGNTTQGSFTPYATNWSNYFGAAGTSRIETPSNSTLAVCNGTNFTVEGWFYWTNTSNTYPNLIQFWTDSSNRWELYANGSNKKLSIYVGISGVEPPYAFYDTNITVPQLQWFHVAVVKQGAITKIYMNGVLGYTSEITYPTGNQKVVVGSGAQETDSYNFSGYASNVRVTNTAVYTTNFTVPTAPLTAISGTVLLTCQSNRFRDASSNNYTITSVNSTNLVTDFGPFSPAYPGAVYNQSDITNWSGYFDGSGDYGRITGSQTALQFGTGDFTVEGWAYSTGATGTYQQILTGGSSWTSGSGGVYWYYNGGSPYIGAAWNQIATNPAVNSGTLATNTWHHFAVVRSGNTLSLYVNGTSVDTLDVTGVSMAVNNQSQTNIGGGGWDQDFGGYLSNLRVVKGTAVYTGNFTPPTTNLTAISGTSLLTLQNAAFTDNSTNNFVITQNGNVTVTGNSPFNTVGYWSNYFDGSGDYLSYPEQVGDLGTADWTLECWAYPTATPPNYASLLNKNWTFSLQTGDFQWSIKHSDGYMSFAYVNGSIVNVTTTLAPALNTWTHYAVTRSGTTLRIYANGVLNTTATLPAGFSFGTASTTSVFTGYNSRDNCYYTGYISNLRIVAGTAVYTGSTYTVPTTPLTAITNTSLLTCQNGRFIDNSTNNFTLTASGNTSAQSFDPFYTATIASNGGSMYFDGSGDYLRGANSPAFSFGTGNFTVEMWAYFMDPTATNRPLFDNGATSNTGRLLIRQGNDAGTANVVNAFVSGTTVSSPAIQFYSWTHVAVVRNSGTVTIYINGVGGTGVSATADLSQNACLLGAFYDQLAWNFTGYMSNVRVTKGTAVYTSNFTPPTAPLTPSANTTLLVNGMNAGIYDATAINDMETVGNAQVSTVQSKFGGSSMYFDGTGDWLDIPSNPTLDFGTGDITIECWLYVTSVATTYQSICQFGDAAGTAGFHILTNTNTICLRTNNSQPLTTSGTITANTWNHIALTRASGTTRLFINGTTSGGTYNWTASLSSGSTRRIGADIYGNPVSGYIDDFRVTRGVARYTSNFTPPTAPFPTY